MQATVDIDEEVNGQLSKKNAYANEAKIST